MQRCNVSSACARPLCIPTFGCQQVSRQCVLNSKGNSVESLDGTVNGTNATTSDCSYAACNVTGPITQTDYICTKISLSCGITTDNTVYIAAGLGAAAIAGIVIAVAVVCGAASGASVAAYQTLGGDADASLHTNPLYESNNKGGNNPLWEQK